MFPFFERKTRVEALAVGAAVVVEGRVVALREIGLPGTAHKCVCYFQHVDRWDRGERGRGRKMWIPVSADQKAEPFLLDDGTGRALIAAGEPGVEVNGGVEETGPFGRKGAQRYIARVIRDGDVVRVRGVVDRPRGAEPGELLAIRPGGKKGRLSIDFRARGQRS